MSVKIRLHRSGATHSPFYRVVVTDSRSPRDGRFIEMIGYYDPLPEKAIVQLDTERVDYWMSKGATASPTVRSIIKKAGTAGAFTTAGEIAEKAHAARMQRIEEVGRLVPQKPKADKPKEGGEKRAEAKPAGKPAQAKPAGKPAQAKSPQAKPAEAKPEAKPAEAKPAEAKPTAAKPADTKSAESN